MDLKRYMSIHEFSALSGITRANLIYYDNENILKPAKRAENGYRQYDYNQLLSAHIIVSLRKSGVSIKKIKEYLNDASYSNAKSLFSSQITEIDRQIEQLSLFKYTLEQFIENITNYEHVKTPFWEITELESEPLALSPPISEIPEDVTTMTQFLVVCRNHGIDCNHPIGRLFSRESFEKRQWDAPDHIFFKKKSGTYHTEQGMYFVYLENTDSSNLSHIYDTVYSLIHKNNLKVTGNVYEDYPLSKICPKSMNQHLIRISVPVQEIYSINNT